MDGQPYEVIESNPSKQAQGRAIIQARIKNLLTGSVIPRNFHQGDSFQEAEITKLEAKFLYTHKDKYFFCEKDNTSKRFDLGVEQIGSAADFLKPNEIVEGVVFQEKIINIILPIKAQLKVIEAPAGFKGDTATGGTKIVILETKAKLNVPMFIKEGDIVEVNTETGGYTNRVK